MKWTFLRPTTGTGQQGAYAILANVPQSLANLRDELRQAVENKLGVESGDKTILNWAHQGQSTCPYQALLLLSRPGFDSEEGKLYVVDPSSRDETANKRVCNKVDFQSSGDLVIFAANDSNPTSRPFYHGMTEVLSGQKRGEKDSHRSFTNLS